MSQQSLSEKLDPRKNKHNGRARVLDVLDKVAGEGAHLERLETELREFIADYGMMHFYATFIKDLIPKEAVLQSFDTYFNSGGNDEGRVVGLKLEVIEGGGGTNGSNGKQHTRKSTTKAS